MIFDGNSQSAYFLASSAEGSRPITFSNRIAPMEYTSVAGEIQSMLIVSAVVIVNAFLRERYLKKEK